MNDMLSYLKNIQTPDQSESTGVSDDIPAMLSEGEFVINAEQVSKLGGGATDPGLRMIEEIFTLVDAMDRDSAVQFAENILMTGELLLEEQPTINEE